MVALSSYAPGVAASAGASLREATPAQRARVGKTAEAFEASFLSSMFGSMFEGTEVSEPFGGGQGEQAFRSFMTDAFGKSMSKHGGIGLSHAVAAEMLKLQGLK